MPMRKLKFNHTDLINVLTSQHHILYTDNEAVLAIEAEDGLTFAGDLLAPSGIIRPNIFKLGVSTELTLASDIITVTGSYHTVDAAGDDPTDDLVTINGGEIGMLLFLRSASSARVITARDDWGNLRLAGDFILDHIRDILVLLYYSADRWIEVSRSNNA